MWMIYILSVVISFTGILYFFSEDSDIKLDDFIAIMFTSIIPLFNIGILVVVIVSSRNFNTNPIVIKKRK